MEFAKYLEYQHKNNKHDNKNVYGFELGIESLKKFEEFQNKNIQILEQTDFYLENKPAQVLIYKMTKEGFKSFFDKFTTDKLIYIFSFRLEKEKKKGLLGFLGFKKTIIYFRGYF